MKNLSSDIYTAMKLLSHFITDAYSLSTNTLYHFFDNKSASINHAVLTHHQAGHENQIEKFIKFFIKNKNIFFLILKSF
jgi:hypothetical protein